MLKTVAIKSKKYHLLGTAHISQQSVDEVEKYITDLKPDAGLYRDLRNKV